MAVHDEVLEAALRIGAERGDWSFTPDQIVRALPHLNPATVRTHVTSRCCDNAPRNHPHKWAYFRRVSRGLYKVLSSARGPARKVRAVERVAEERASYGGATLTPLRDVIHGVLSKSGAHFVGECLEVAVVTQGRTLDETLANLREAIALHLGGEDLSALGFSAAPRLLLTYEIQLSEQA